MLSLGHCYFMHASVSNFIIRLFFGYWERKGISNFWCTMILWRVHSPLLKQMSKESSDWNLTNYSRDFEILLNIIIFHNHIFFGFELDPHTRCLYFSFFFPFSFIWPTLTFKMGGIIKHVYVFFYQNKRLYMFINSYFAPCSQYRTLIVFSTILISNKEQYDHISFSGSTLSMQW